MRLLIIGVKLPRDQVDRNQEHRLRHKIVNRTNADVLYLEVGDRTAGDAATYPDDDLQAALGGDGKWQYAHKDGTPY